MCLHQYKWSYLRLVWSNRWYAILFGYYDARTIGFIPSLWYFFWGWWEYVHWMQSGLSGARHRAVECDGLAFGCVSLFVMLAWTNAKIHYRVESAFMSCWPWWTITTQQSSNNSISVRSLFSVLSFRVTCKFDHVPRFYSGCRGSCARPTSDSTRLRIQFFWVTHSVFIYSELVPDCFSSLHNQSLLWRSKYCLWW